MTGKLDGIGTIAASRLWNNSLLHVRDDVPGAQHPRKPEVFIP
jgi:hypothetical protein